ncbi:hypothetical protein OG894_44705 (plasmid) [Streptomyces sp. NBC_01724]|uniref:hypothetical protein n=1 Tax=Streptomyces sp. NBC_01724 TaxID=2975922 RepID=UPI002E324E42|nr:hypothetical protein [Streptomyces sp. NBC_01724]
MSYEHRDLNLTYESAKGWAHFVLCIEPKIGVTGAALNATVLIQWQTSYVREWVGRLQRCEPSALHATFVQDTKLPGSMLIAAKQDIPNV